MTKEDSKGEVLYMKQNFMEDQEVERGWESQTSYNLAWLAGVAVHEFGRIN